MADNVRTGADGGLRGFDEIENAAGEDVKFQRVKIITGADGVNEGDVSFDSPLPVEVIVLETLNDRLAVITALLERVVVSLDDIVN